MPKRNAIAKARMATLPKKLPDQFCNGRTPNTASGYCGNVAGFKTDHVGSGRCWLHGGASKGAPIKSGLYSRVLTASAKDKIAELQENSQFLKLTDELGILKYVLMALTESLSKSLEEGENVVTTINASGSPIVSPRFNAFLALLEKAMKMQKAILDVEIATNQVLTVSDVQSFLSQLSYILSQRCDTCPVRGAVSTDFITKIKFKHEGNPNVGKK